MRILIGFGLCCAAMAAALLWMMRPAMLAPARSDARVGAGAPQSQFATHAEALAPPAASYEFAASPTSSKANSQLAVQMPITERTAPTASAAESRKRGTVRPAGARQREQIERKLSDALDAIARDSQNTVALDDALAAAIELNDEPRIADLLGRKVHASPDDPELRFAYAAALMRLRQWVLALPELRTVITERPEHVRAWHNLALALRALGSLSDARDAWGRVIALSPSDLDSRARRAEILLDLGDWRNAAADLEFIIAADASATDAALNLALARLKLREFDAARAAIRPLLDIEPLKMTAHRRMQEIDLAQREVSTAP